MTYCGKIIKIKSEPEREDRDNLLLTTIGGDKDDECLLIVEGISNEGYKSDVTIPINMIPVLIRYMWQIYLDHTGETQ